MNLNFIQELVEVLVGVFTIIWSNDFDLHLTLISTKVLKPLNWKTSDFCFEKYIQHIFD